MEALLLRKERRKKGGNGSACMGHYSSVWVRCMDVVLQQCVEYLKPWTVYDLAWPLWAGGGCGNLSSSGLPVPVPQTEAKRWRKLSKSKHV
eukprot:282649-Pelagomonas_calceolata.AAC.3